MQLLKNFILPILTIGFIFASCTKAGIGGKATIAAFPKHHDTPIPDCAIYIKYDAIEFPGTDLSVYDDVKIAEGHGEDPHVHFEELKKGDYYLYGVGFDSAIGLPVTGGIPVEIKDKDEEIEVVVPVTE